MSHLSSNYAIVVERSLSRISFVDTDTLTVIHQINIPDSDILDVDITNDNTKAAVTSFNIPKLVEIDLTTEPPVLQSVIESPSYLEDVSITPNSRFAVSVDGNNASQNIVSVNLLNQSIKFIPADAQAVAVSPNGNGHILTARYSAGRVRLYLIDENGDITDTGSESQVNDSPINITYSPNGDFAFVANIRGQEIVVLDTSNPNYYGEASRIYIGPNLGAAPQTIVVSDDGSKVYVLGFHQVKVFNFDPIAKRLTLVNTFFYTGDIHYFGVDQMVLDTTQTKLLIATTGGLHAFTTSGTFLGTVPDVSPDGGIATNKRYAMPSNFLLATDTDNHLLIINPETLNIISQVTLGVEGIGVAVTDDRKTAVITSFSDNQFLKVDLSAIPPVVTNTAIVPTPLESVEITPDNSFAVSVDGGPGTTNIASYDILNNATKYIPADAQSVAVSPNGNGHILTTHYYEGRVRLYTIDNDGNLSDTGMESQVNDSPINITYSPDGKFAFVANNLGNEVVVLDTSNPNYYGETSRIYAGTNPQTILTTANGQTVYVLNFSEVRTYSFDPIAKRLALVNSFSHNLTIRNYYGLNQMILNVDETKLFILSENGLAVFTTSGQLAGTLPGALNGIALAK